VKKCLVGLAIAVVATAALLGGSTASAATLVGDYQLQGTMASSGPGVPATEIGGGGNSFASDNVMGTTRQALNFPRGSGVGVSPAGIGSGLVAYSAVTTFKLADVEPFHYERVLDPLNGAPDQGFYVYDGKAEIYPIGPSVDGTNQVFASNIYVTAVLVSDPNAPASRFYVNGNLEASTSELMPVTADTLRFFKDNNGGTEDSAGAVSCIRVYSGALSTQEIAGIGASPTCGTVATPPAKKKCKKHKKKRSADAAKKKKCKKKKKR
jgi:hypothetical protein